MLPSERATVLGVLVALVGKLAARSDHRPARHRFAWAPSRLLGNLGIRLMSPLARRTPQDQSRGPRAYSPDEPREFLMGRPADPWRAAETRTSCLASHSVPLNAATGLSAHPEWRTFLRNQAFAIGAIGFGEAGRLSDVVRGWIMRVGRCATKVRDGIPCRLIEPSWPCTRCGHIALPIVEIGASPKGVACPAPPRPTPQSGTHWTWPVDDFHRIAQGHHRHASCPTFANCTRSSAIARRAKRTTIPLRRLHCASATNNPKQCKGLPQKVKIFKACRYLAIPLRFGYRGQGYEKRQGTSWNVRLSGISAFVHALPQLARKPSQVNGSRIAQSTRFSQLTAFRQM
jgi:hypothetical protein